MYSRFKLCKAKLKETELKLRKSGKNYLYTEWTASFQKTKSPVEYRACLHSDFVRVEKSNLCWDQIKLQEEVFQDPRQAP